MKKILPAFIFFALAQCAFSQNIRIASSEVSISDKGDSNENLTSNNISTKAFREFKKNFKTVTNEKWFDLTDMVRAKFTLDNISYKVDYDKRGHWLHTIRSYSEKELSSDVRQQVKMTYFDYAIVLVDEIDMPRNQKSYIVHLEGQTNWINLRISDGEMDEWQNFKKAQ